MPQLTWMIFGKLQKRFAPNTFVDFIFESYAKECLLFKYTFYLSAVLLQYTSKQRTETDRKK